MAGDLRNDPAMDHVSPALVDDCHPTPLSSLTADVVPAGEHFLRSHFGVPAIDPTTWTVTVDGAVERPLRWTLPQFRHLSRLSHHVVLECAGHRRTEFEPPAPGVPWGLGAVGHARWSGGALADLLGLVRPTPGANTIVLHGADTGPVERREEPESFSRAIPLRDPVVGKTILAWEMNGQGLHPAHGGPLRAIVPGWYAVASVKWLQRIELIEGDFDGYFQAVDYRILEAGETGPGRPLTRLPISSLILDPADGATTPETVEIAGIAWGGTGGVAAVDLQVDDGEWTPARIDPGRGADAPTRFSATLTIAAGAHVVRSRARDRDGARQPETDPWNQRGYGVSSPRAITITVGD